MNQVNARHEIIREWRSLPRELRQTDEQAAAFAMQIKDKYKFSSDSADHYQTVKDWLLRYLSITRGLEPNAEDEGRMKGDAKSTDPGLSATERKTLRSREAKEAIAEHEALRRHFMKTAVRYEPVSGWQFPANREFYREFCDSGALRADFVARNRCAAATS